MACFDSQNVLQIAICFCFLICLYFIFFFSSASQHPMMNFIEDDTIIIANFVISNAIAHFYMSPFIA